MKVMFVTQTAATDGGIERWLSSLATGLADCGVDVTLALVDGPVFHDATKYLSAFPELNRLPHVVVHSESGTARGRLRRLEQALREQRPDIVVPVLVHETLAAVLRRKDAGDTLKLVYPIHENEVWAYNAVAEWPETIDAVVSVNALMLQALQAWAGWATDRSFHIRAGVEPASTLHDWRPANARLVLGYCGKLIENQKRASDLVGLCAELDALHFNYELRIAGEGPLRSTMENALAHHIADGRVSFLGALGKQALHDAFYPALDALVITSDWETGPLVAWEAMMHGTAIVTSAYRGLRSEKLLTHDETALVFPVGDPRAAARVIAQDPAHDRLRKIGVSGRATAERELTDRMMVDRWMNMLRQVMGMAAVPSRDAAPARPASMTDWLEDPLRSVLARPLAHSNAHEEWPRYQSGWVAQSDRQAFSRRLDELEAEVAR